MTVSADSTTILVEDVTTLDAVWDAERPIIDSSRLAEIVGWELKPEGLCRDVACVPVPDRSVLEHRDGVNLAAVAVALGRPVLVALSNKDFISESLDLPLADDVPTAFDGVPKGPRSFGWRADRAATVYWVEAQDDGDPTREAEIRDCLYTLSEPFDGEQSVLQELALRFAGANWCWA